MPSRLSKKCRECSFVDKCQNKRMEAEAYAMPVTMPGVAELMQPMAVIEKQMVIDFYKTYGRVWSV